MMFDALQRRRKSYFPENNSSVVATDSPAVIARWMPNKSIARAA
jgi:hypothetical protein